MASKPLQLQKWYLASARSLPWRQDQKPISKVNPYWIWLSEIMLQQTQVKTVIPYFQKFLQVFPTVQDLASASIDQVYELWAGLGYYSRARNLHRGAQAIASRIERGLGFPKTREEWLEIPGVGPYTAGALCSIALNQPEALVDGNVARVVSRVYGLTETGTQHAKIWPIAKRWVQDKSVEPRLLNQALMELGATFCKPRAPLCGQCPIQKGCVGKSNPELYPQKKKRVKVVQIQESRMVLLRLESNEWSVALSKNVGTQWRSGLYDFPAQVPTGLKRAKKLTEFKSQYVVTRHRVQRQHEVWVLSKAGFKSTTGIEWFALGKLPAVPAPVKKALAHVQSLATGD